MTFPLAALNSLLQRAMPLLAPGSVVAGVLIGEPAARFSGGVFWVFAFMTFAAGLSIRLADLRAVLRHPGALGIIFILLHGVMPLVGWSVGSWFENTDIRTGLVLITLAPVGVTSMIWVGLYRGNVSLALSVIVLDTLLTPFILPVLLSFFAGTQVNMDSVGILTSLCGMLLVPTVLAAAVTRISGGAVHRICGSWLALGSKLGIVFLLVVNGGIAAPYFAHPTWSMLVVLATVFLLCCTGYALSYAVGSRLFSNDADIMAFTLCGGLRNVAASAAIAVLYCTSVTCFTVAMGMLFQQILGYNAGLMVRRRLDAAGGSDVTAP